MKFQTLISTMFQNDYDLIQRMKIQSDAIVINQCNTDSIVELDLKSSRIVWINSSEIGLSRSRNMAIDHASSEIAVIADDDLEYIDGYDQVICNEFNRIPHADIIAFQVIGIEKEFKKYNSRARKIGFLSSLKISSVEIAFRTRKIKSRKLRFDIQFGSGAKYKMGEENIFLFDCLRSGLRVYYVPIVIARLHLGNSSWFEGFNESYFFNKGAAFYAMSSTFSRFLIIAFLIKKFSVYKSSINIVRAMKCMIAGMDSYRESISIK